MAFYNFKNTSFLFNGKLIPITNCELNSEANLENTFLANERISNNFTQNGPVVSTISLNFYLTGACPIASYIQSKSSDAISGNFGGINFQKGYLASYGLNISPLSPIVGNCVLNIYDELSGVFNTTSPSSLTGKVLNSSDITFTTYSPFDLTIPQNIIGLTWNYKNDLIPVYFPSSSNQLNHNAERIIIGPKTISAQITSDNLGMILPVSGENFAMKVRLNSPTIIGAYQDFNISGRITSKNISSTTNQSTRGSFSVIQANIGSVPIITGVTGVLAGGYTNQILIQANTSNGFYSNDGNISLIERVTIGGISYSFSVATNGTTDSITANVPIDAINGYLSVETTKGIIQYPVFQSLIFPSPSISGFSPETGMIGQTVLISGSNFYRVTDVFLGGQKVKFQVKTLPTGLSAFHEINTQLPVNSLINKIQVVSTTRNVSGISTGNFYPLFEITKILPQSGRWGDVLTISGKNFSGITALMFNSGIPSPSFRVINNFTITGKVPAIGVGYTKGLIHLSGFQKMINYSTKPYIPRINITSISSPSGQIGDVIYIYGLFDSGFLNSVGNNYYKVGFGPTATGAFYFSGSNVLTGLMPDSSQFNSGFISIFEPDGVTRYESYTGFFSQVGPAPIVRAVYPKEVNLYKSFILNIEGDNIKDFFGLPHYLTLSGSGNLQNYVALTHNAFHTKAVFSGIRITGGTGDYLIRFRNFAGYNNYTGQTGVFLRVLPSINEAARGIVSHSPIPSITVNASKYSPGKAADYHTNTYSFTDTFTDNLGAYLAINFSQAIDVSYIRICQTGIPKPLRLKVGDFGRGSVYKNYYTCGTGEINLIDGGNQIVYGSTISQNFDLSDGLNIDLTTSPITGIKRCVIYSRGTFSEAQNMCLGFDTVSLY